MLPPLDPGWASLFIALFGGLILEIVRKLLGRRQTKVDEASKIRDELRDQIDDLKDDIKGLENDRDDYRNKYYDLYAKYIEQAADLKSALQDIKSHTGKAGRNNDPPK